MAKKYKLTGFARFFLFLIVFVPVVFLGVSYFSGEDPISSIKNIELPKMNKQEKSTVTEESIINESLKIKDNRIDELTIKVEELEAQIKRQAAEIRRLKG